MFQKIMIFCLFIGSYFIVEGSYASKSMDAPKCKVKGLVQTEETRFEDGKGLSEGVVHEYHDLAIQVLENDYLDEAEREAFENSGFADHCQKTGEEVTYQLRESSFPFAGDVSLVGKCVRAETNFSADGNFRSGNWIYNIEVLEDGVCDDGN